MMHVPSLSRITPAMHPVLGTDHTYGNNGAFQLPSPEPGWTLFLICSDGNHDDAVGELADWEHVSVSVRRTPLRFAGEPVRLRRDNVTRTPTWNEMVFAKRLCWDDDDCIVQYHPKAADYVNVHPNVLHMWRWKAGSFPTPPTAAV